MQRKKFYGTATVGERGQVVIPADARRALKLKPGEKLLVFGVGNMLACSKLAELEKLAAHLTTKANTLKSIIKKSI